VDESTCLESMRLGNGTVGSNPTLSAKPSLLDPEPHELGRRDKYLKCSVLRGWDSNRGFEGGYVPFKLARTGRHIDVLGGRIKIPYVSTTKALRADRHLKCGLGLKSLLDPEPHYCGDGINTLRARGWALCNRTL
jgi:hypothetical protein